MLAELLATEMSIGGGGQLASFEGVSLRYILLGTVATIGICRIVLGHRIPVVYAKTMALVLFYICYGVALGLYNAYPMNDVMAAAGQYSAWLILPYLITELTVGKIKKIDSIFIWSGLGLASIYLLYQIACFVGMLDPQLFFEIYNDSTEFFFRGTQYFFYKGFTYFAVSALLIVGIFKHFKGIALLILIAATALMSLRGFMAALIIALLFDCYFYGQKKTFFWIASVSAVGLAVAFLYIPNSIDGFAEIRNASDEYRQNDIQTVLEKSNVVSVLFGNGFGMNINDRAFLENSYVDIYVKTGLIGLILYVVSIINLFLVSDIGLRCNRNQSRLKAYFSVIIFLLLVSVTNPFINNTIGIFLIMYFAVASNSSNINALGQGKFELARSTREA